MQRCIRTLSFLLTVVFASISAKTARADEVTDWNQILFQAALVAQTSPLFMSRNTAIVQASVFDAVNGIERRYTPIHVKPDAPRGASARAAAVQAAYASLVKLYPAQQSTFNAARATSLTAILKKKGDWDEQQERQKAVYSGVAWGQEVADAIWAWRSTDGFTPPPAQFIGGSQYRRVASHSTCIRYRSCSPVRLHDAMGDHDAQSISPGRPSCAKQCPLR